MTSTTLTEIPFHEQAILAQQGENGTVRVALKPLCDNMNIDYSSQLKRLKRQEWATVAMMTTVGADGKTREMIGIDRRTFSMWLATIDTARVKNEDAKNLIVAYQCEAADVLDAYFFGDTQKSVFRRQGDDAHADRSEHRIGRSQRGIARDSARIG